VNRIVMAIVCGVILMATACSSSGPTARSTGPSSPTASTGQPSAVGTSAPPAWRGQFTGYGTSGWEHSWGYLSDGSFGQAQLDVVRDASVPGGGQVLRVLYGEGSSANSCTDCPHPGGAQFYTSFDTIGQPGLSTAPVLYLRYYLKFPGGFDFGRGGKLPGLYGGSIGAESGGNHGDGFSTRYMWRDHHVSGSVHRCSSSAPCAEVYLYAPDLGREYGRDLGGQWQWQADGNWHMVEQRVDRATGDIPVWYDGTEVLNEPGALTGSAGIPFAGVMFSTFFGGHDTSWGPSKAEYAYFTDFAVSTTYIGAV
jgi:hypothetical protein